MNNSYLCQKQKKRIEDGYRGVEKSEGFCHKACAN